MQDSYAKLASQLDALVSELRRRDLWSDQQPSAQALSSSAPFCHDTLAFHQWLQWLFIPKVRELITLRAPLPPDCNIAPMAEVSYAEADWDSTDLVDLLRAIDHSFSQFDDRLH
jgi:uncharacterized protein YqcC (DUF446 family)